MYAGDADFFGIVEAREAFLRDREYEKTIHERNFKHWLMHVEHLVDAKAKFNRHTSGRKKSGQEDAPGQVGHRGDLAGHRPHRHLQQGQRRRISGVLAVQRVCFDQSAVNPDICVAGIEAGDLFKTVDRGLTWHPITEGVPGIRPCAP